MLAMVFTVLLSLNIAHAQDGTDGGTPIPPENPPVYGGVTLSAAQKEELRAMIQEELAKPETQNVIDLRVSQKFTEQETGLRKERLASAKEQYTSAKEHSATPEGFLAWCTLSSELADQLEPNNVRSVDSDTHTFVTQMITDVRAEKDSRFAANATSATAFADNRKSAKTNLATFINQMHDTDSERTALYSALNSMVVLPKGKNGNTLVNTLMAGGGGLVAANTFGGLLVKPESDGAKKALTFLGGTGVVAGGSGLVLGITKSKGAVRDITTRLYLNGAFTDAIVILQDQNNDVETRQNACLTEVGKILHIDDENSRPTNPEITSAAAKFSQCYELSEQRMDAYDHAVQSLRSGERKLTEMNTALKTAGLDIFDDAVIKTNIDAFATAVQRMHDQYAKSKVAMERSLANIQNKGRDEEAWHDIEADVTIAYLDLSLHQ